MTENNMRLPYGRPAKRKTGRLLVAGACLLVLAFLMAVIGASIFVMPTMPAKPVYVIGGICMYGFSVVGIAAVALLIVGIVRAAQ